MEIWLFQTALLLAPNTQILTKTEMINLLMQIKILDNQHLAWAGEKSQQHLQHHPCNLWRGCFQSLYMYHRLRPIAKPLIAIQQLFLMPAVKGIGGLSSRILTTKKVFGWQHEIVRDSLVSILSSSMVIGI